MSPVGRDLRERTEDESTRLEARVRELEIGGRADLPAKIEEVQVDFSRSVSKGRRTAEPLFDALEHLEQRARPLLPRDLGDGVDEPRLVCVSDGIGAVEGGNAIDRRFSLDFFECAPQEGLRVTEIGAEADVDRTRDARIRTPLPAPGPLRRSLPRPRDLPRRERAPLPQPALRTRSWSLRESAP